MYQTYPNISISGILNGKTDAYDFQKYLRNIYTETEIQKIEEYWKEKRKKENKLTTNDDLNRYIGHENGVLNYVNLPWNLTMQTNQGGEFTDISFLFFALIPLIFIFLPFRNKYFFLFFVTFLFLYTFFIYIQSIS